MKHITLSCLHRSGSTAYCNHLMNTGLVDSDILQEAMTKFTFWPCLDTDEQVDLTFKHLPLDIDFQKLLLYKEEDITESVLRTHYKEDWVWLKYDTENDFKFIKSKEIPTQQELDDYYKNLFHVLNHTNKKYVIKNYYNKIKVDYPTEHHVLIRDPLDNLLSQIFADKTKWWHGSKNENNDYKKRISRIDKINLEDYKQALIDYCENNLGLIKQFQGNAKIIKYEDVQFDTHFKKLWTYEEKLVMCNNIHTINPIVKNYKEVLDILLEKC